MNFSQALEQLKAGSKIARSGWNGKGMYLFLVSGYDWDLDKSEKNVTEIDELLPFICMKTADNKLVPWLASQTDILANDWEVVD